MTQKIHSRRDAPYVVLRSITVGFFFVFACVIASPAALASTRNTFGSLRPPSQNGGLQDYSDVFLVQVLGDPRFNRAENGKIEEELLKRARENPRPIIALLMVSLRSFDRNHLASVERLFVEIAGEHPHEAIGPLVASLDETYPHAVFIAENLLRRISLLSGRHRETVRALLAYAVEHNPTTSSLCQHASVLFDEIDHGRPPAAMIAFGSQSVDWQRWDTLCDEPACQAILACYPAQIAFVREHARRTAQVAYLIAEKLGLCEEDMRDVIAASLMHDIGKGDEEIMPIFLHIDRGGVLYDEAEINLLMLHPHYSVNMARTAGISVSKTVEIAVRCHHRFNPSRIRDSIAGHGFYYADVDIERALLITQIVYLADTIESSQNGTVKTFSVMPSLADVVDKRAASLQERGIIREDVALAVARLNDDWRFLSVIEMARESHFSDRVRPDTWALRPPAAGKATGKKKAVEAIMIEEAGQ